ncbi:MAG: cyclic nucleotide-binding domain-containing protein [Myxococcales bacterium]|nr:cyclic nucleotide-binding domain-containing protein [Myxococcales bacterium]MCB9642532.1 cyclic nucleotide-binding domain-containing protein [Myxococcales bacterium]
MRPTPNSPLSTKLDYLGGLQLFQSLHTDVLRSLCEAVQWRSLHEGEVLFYQGDQSKDGCFLLVDGELEVLLLEQDGKEAIVATIHHDELVGENALLSGGTRTATVRAKQACQLLQLAPSELQGEQAWLEKLSHLLKDRYRQTRARKQLTELFGSFETSLFEWLEEESTWFALGFDQVLFSQGDTSDAMYLLVSGSLQVLANKRDQRETKTRYVPGELLGEVAFFTGSPYAFTVRATRDCELLRLPRQTCERLLQRLPQALGRLSRQLAQRLEQQFHTTSQARQGLVMALVPVSQSPLCQPFQEQLLEALRERNTAIVVSAKDIEERFHSPGASLRKEGHLDSLRFHAWLDELQEKYEFLLLLADAAPSQWTQKCLLRADHALFVVDASLEPSMRAFDELTCPCPQDLILLHNSPDTPPTQTSRWLDLFVYATRHHHVAVHSKQHMDRLLRNLSRRGFGLVLGGGGARGFAHIGVLRALEELEIPIDLCAGTSMGGLVGALIAQGWDSKMIEEKFHEILRSFRVLDYTLPIVSILRGERFNTILNKLFEDLDIADTWRTFYCVSSNLTTATEQWHHQGSLWKAVRSSCSLPLFLPPVYEDGHLLADGGLLNNIPVDRMEALNPYGTTIAVNVSSDIEELFRVHATPDFRTSGWHSLWRRLFSNSYQQTPNLLNSLLRSMELASSKHTRELCARADVQISPQVSAFGALDLKSSKEIIEEGYRSAISSLTSWKEQQQ